MISIQRRPTGSGTHIDIGGVIDEDSDFSALADLGGRVEISLKDIRRVNSFGARAWMEAIRGIVGRASVTFIECPPAIIDQLNMIQGFLANCRVESFFAPMRCDDCDLEELHLVDGDECRALDGALPPVSCDGCGQPMMVDDLEDQYTLFLREPTMVGG